MDKRRFEGNALSIVATLMVVSLVFNGLFFSSLRQAQSKVHAIDAKLNETAQVLSQKQTEISQLNVEIEGLQRDLLEAKNKLSNSNPNPVGTAIKDPRPTTPVSGTPSTSASHSSSSGAHLRFKDQPNQDVPVWTTKSAFNEGSKHFARDDMYGLTEQLLSGDFGIVDPGTACKLLESGLGWVKVRVTEGEIEGVAVYTFAEAFND